MYSPSLIDTKTQYFHLKLLVLFLSIANMVKFVCNWVLIPVKWYWSGAIIVRFCELETRNVTLSMHTFLICAASLILESTRSLLDWPTVHSEVLAERYSQWKECPFAPKGMHTFYMMCRQAKLRINNDSCIVPRDWIVNATHVLLSFIETLTMASMLSLFCRPRCSVRASQKLLCKIWLFVIDNS